MKDQAKEIESLHEPREEQTPIWHLPWLNYGMKHMDADRDFFSDIGCCNGQ